MIENFNLTHVCARVNFFLIIFNEKKYTLKNCVIFSFFEYFFLTCVYDQVRHHKEEQDREKIFTIGDEGLSVHYKGHRHSGA